MTDRPSASPQAAGEALITLLQQVALASNEADSLEEALPVVLREICRYTGWTLGHVYLPGAEAPGELWPSSCWHLADPGRFANFQAVTQRTRFAKGVGLPGRVWATGKPAWSPDVTVDPNFPRAALARDLGVGAGFAFPVSLDQEVVAVLEFFTEAATEPDEALLDVMTHVGSLLGRVEERRRAREALRASEARYRTLSETAIDAIVTAEGTADGTGVICDWNKGAETIFGYRREEVIGEPLTLLMPARYIERHQAGMARTHTTGETHVIGHTVELHGLRKNGEEFPLELSLTRWKAGGKAYYTGIIRDTTERKRSEEEVYLLNAALEKRVRERTEHLEQRNAELRRQVARRRKAERRVSFLAQASFLLAQSLGYEETLQRVADLAIRHLADWCAVSMAAPEGTFEYVAVAHREPEKVAWARELSRQYPPDPESAHGTAEVMRTGRSALYREITDELLQASARDEAHLALLRRVGIRSAMIVPMTARGRTLGTMLFVWSETRRRYSKEDLRLAEELARRAALEVDNALLYREAEAARRRAEAASRAKSAFLANMSHEIRTPLTAIIGFASLLERQVPTQYKESTQRIESAGRRLMDTLNAVLTLAKLEANHVEAPTEALVVAGEAREVVHLFQQQAWEKGLLLRFLVAPGAEAVKSRLDRGSLTSILQNLISNAIKFTEQGGITVSVETEGASVHLGVEDTGIGIEGRFMVHLFEPFRQASSGFSRSHEGSGLGLAITKQLVDKMGGAIAVDSTEGVGTRVRVTFPILGAAPSGSPGEQGGGGSLAAPEAPVRVLVVEDNEDTQVLLKSLLKSLGDVVVVGSAEEALAEAERRRYDLVLLDINLGGGPSGTEVLRALRARAAYRTTPMAALTAYALPGDREAFLSEGFNAYLQKPFTVAELMRVTSRLLVR